MVHKKHFKRLSQKDFDFIKILLKNGQKPAMVARVIGRSDTTVGYVKRASSLVEYRSIIRVINEKNYKPKQLPSQGAALTSAFCRQLVPWGSKPTPSGHSLHSSRSRRSRLANTATRPSAASPSPRLRGSGRCHETVPQGRDPAHVSTLAW